MSYKEAISLLREAIALLGNDAQEAHESELSETMCRRENHFRECLNQLQAKQKNNLSGDVLMQVWMVLQDRHGVTKPEDVELFMIRPALKELERRVKALCSFAGLSSVGVTNPRKLYEHYVLIYTRLSGKPPPRLTPKRESNMFMMFRAIQKPFERHCPADRTNFLSYNYCLYKFCQLMGYTDFLRHITLLKRDAKLSACDDIMKKIFADLGWTWIPTLPRP